MIITNLKEKTAELKQKVIDCMKGEITFTKLDFFLIVAICLLGGICIGLLTAPYTHGVTIASNNGNNNGNNCGNNNGLKDKRTELCDSDAEEDAQEME